jgi:HTH-type transcriptional regulator / antitoxin HigA
MDILKPNIAVRVIESEEDYDAALEQIAGLMVAEPPTGSDAERLLKTLAVLIRDYETKHYSLDPPDPIEAIRFRMEQQGLAAKDLIPYLGSRSKVSEVLAGKRPLSVSMMRNLHRGLGIPAASLLSDNRVEETTKLNWKRVPFAEMRRRGWIQNLPRSASEAARLLEEWASPVRDLELAPMYRHHIRSAKTVNHESLAVWTIQVAKRALEAPPSGEFSSEWSAQFFRDLVRLSAFSNGPALAKEFLDHHGIAMVVEAKLTTGLDGAAMTCHGIPVVALTIRYDRLDNFWFVLMHELVHLFKHLNSTTESFYDDLDSDDQADPREVEADQLAGELLIPREEWEHSPARTVRSVVTATHLAQKLQIHPAIVAGRVRKIYKDYRVLSGLVGQGEVRKHFPEFRE